MHMPRNLGRPVCLSAFATASLPMLALAAGTATIDGKSMSDGAITIMWQDDGALRINPDPNTPENYMIIRDGKVYNVSRSDGKPMVMEVGGMLKAFGAMAADSQTGEQAIPAGIESVKATGKSETVAGIEGHVYKVTTVKADGPKKTDEATLSSDPRRTKEDRWRKKW